MAYPSDDKSDSSDSLSLDSSSIVPDAPFPNSPMSFLSDLIDTPDPFPELPHELDWCFSDQLMPEPFQESEILQLPELSSTEDVLALFDTVPDEPSDLLKGSEPENVFGYDPNSLSGSDPKSVSAPDPKSLSEADLKPESGSGPKSLSGSDPRSISGPDPNSLSGSALKFVNEPDPEFVSISDSKSESCLDQKSLSGDDPNSLSGSDPKSVWGPEPNSLSGSELKSGSGSDPLSGLETLTAADSMGVEGTSIETLADGISEVPRGKRSRRECFNSETTDLEAEPSVRTSDDEERGSRRRKRSKRRKAEECVETGPSWLPEGWTVICKARTGGATAGLIDKVLLIFVKIECYLKLMICFNLG